MTQQELDLFQKNAKRGSALSIAGILILMLVYSFGSWKLYSISQEYESKKKAIVELDQQKQLLETKIQTLKTDLHNSEAGNNEPNIVSQIDTSTVKNTSKNIAKRNTVKILLFGASETQLNSLENVLESTKKYYVIGKESQLQSEINTVWYSPDLDYSIAKEVALLLVAQNIKVVAIKPSSKNKRTNTIQIGSTKSFAYFQSMSRQVIENSSGPILMSSN